MEFPEDLYYSRDHEWVRINGEEATIGITAFAAGELGDIVYIDVNQTGKELAAGTVFGTIEAVKTVSDLFLPVGGTVLRVNPQVLDYPELVNQDPYGKGWLAKVRVSSAAAPGTLLTDTQYRKLIAV